MRWVCSGQLPNKKLQRTWVRLQNGNEGWAPKEYIGMLDKSKKGIAKSNYTARELDIEIGDNLHIRKSPDAR